MSINVNYQWWVIILLTCFTPCCQYEFALLFGFPPLIYFLLACLLVTIVQTKQKLIVNPKGKSTFLLIINSRIKSFNVIPLYLHPLTASNKRGSPFFQIKCLTNVELVSDLSLVTWDSNKNMYCKSDMPKMNALHKINSGFLGWNMVLSIISTRYKHFVVSQNEIYFI